MKQKSELKHLYVIPVAPHLEFRHLELSVRALQQGAERTEVSLLSKLGPSDPNVGDAWQSRSFTAKDTETSERKDKLFSARFICNEWVAIWEEN